MTVPAAVLLLFALILMFVSFALRSRRRRYIAALLSGLCSVAAGGVGLLGCAHGPAVRTRTPHVQNLNAVAITVLCEDMSTYIGSGVAVGPQHVLTAAHVVEACDAPPLLLLVESAGEEHIALIDAIAPRADVARIELIVSSLPLEMPVEIGPVPATGEPVCVTARNPYTSRRCGVVEYSADETHGIRFDAIVEPGNSGSALYDSAGRLVGIVTKLYYCHNGQICGGMATPLVSRQWVLTW